MKTLWILAVFVVLILVGSAVAILMSDDVRRFIFQPTPTPIIVVVVATRTPPTNTPVITSTATLTPTSTAVIPPAPVIVAVPTSTVTRTSTPTHTPRPSFTSTATPPAPFPTVTTSTSTPSVTPTPTSTPIVCGYAEMVLMGAGKKHTPCYTPTPTATLEPGATRVVLPTSTPMPSFTPLSTATPQVIIAPTQTPSLPVYATATPTPTKTPSAAPENATDSSPHMRHLKEKQMMLELINSERIKAGLGPVELGNNAAAQLHAESELENCFSSHWGVDGLKPYMRYSLAGGYQSNRENGSGSNYCIRAGDGYSGIGPLERRIERVMEGLMASPGHRSNILGRFHKKVNIGLAWDRFNFYAAQHFEGDYSEFSELPRIESGTLHFEGIAKNGVRFSENQRLSVQIYYDPPPHELTRGQVARTYCSDSGLLVVALRPPLPPRWHYPEGLVVITTKEPCPDPYKVPRDAAVASSPSEAHRFWQEAYNASSSLKERTVQAPWITASKWTADGNSFSVSANINEVLEEHGDGVYTIMVWGTIGGERAIISRYSVFSGVTPPDSYTPR